MNKHRSQLSTLLIASFLLVLVKPVEAQSLQENLEPLSDAGLDQIVTPSSLVTLDGSASTDPDENLPLTYYWTQTEGTTVTLNGSDTAFPSFIAPDSPEALIFSLMVTDSLGMPAVTTDDVKITVDYNYVYLPIIMSPNLPAPFGKSGPDSFSIDQSVTPTLFWTLTSPLSHYEYCYDITNDNACSNWINTGTSTSVTLPSLTPNTTYYWQVRAWNGTTGPTYAQGSSTDFWSFKTIQLPGGFSKNSPFDGATDQSIAPTLSWNLTSPATDYEYCYDTTNDNLCSTWIPTGPASFATLPTLSPNTTYFWQVRAWNDIGGPTYANGSATAFWSFTTMPPWNQLFYENFEGTFPGNWDLLSYWYLDGNWYDLTSEISWGKSDCLKYDGSYSGRAVGGGSLGNSVSCGDGYLDDYIAWMTYGPFNLSLVKNGFLSVKYWSDIDDNYFDKAGWGISIDNIYFYGSSITGNSDGWQYDVIDLKNVSSFGNVTGQPQVWIGVWFISDSYYLGPRAGVWVDDISLTVCNSAVGCSGTPLMTAGNLPLHGINEGSASKSIPNSGFAPEAHQSTTLDFPWVDQMGFITDRK